MTWCLVKYRDNFTFYLYVITELVVHMLNYVPHHHEDVWERRCMAPRILNLGTTWHHGATGIHFSKGHKDEGRAYEGVSKSFRTESITKYKLTTINTRWEATQGVMAAKLTRLTQNSDTTASSGRQLLSGGQSGLFWIHPRIVRPDSLQSKVTIGERLEFHSP
jgi:hypothetical protein